MVDTPVPATRERRVIGSRARSIWSARSMSRVRIAGSFVVEGAARVAAKLGVTPLPPLTGIGVVALAEPALMVEIEATAVLA